jgi:hypothetical protein
MSEQQVSEVRTSNREPKSNRDQRLFTFKTTYIIWLVLVMLEGLIALRVGLKLIGANEASPFAMLVYGVSNLFLFPFAGLTGTPAAGGLVLEVSSLIAMVVYALIFWAIERVVWVIFYRPREAPVAVTHRTSNEQHTK